MTFEEIDNILQACRALRPGTAWNISADKASYQLTQAEDDSPRVVPPTAEEIQAYIESQK